MSIKIQKLLYKFIIQPRSVKTFIAISLDFACIFFSVWIAYYLRLGVFVSLFQKTGIACLLSLLISIPIFFVFGLYKAIFRYSGLPALFTVVKAIFFYALIFFGFITQTRILFIPRTIGLIQPLILLLFIGSWRMILAYFLSGAYQKQFNIFNIKNVLVYGAGEAGRHRWQLQLAQAVSPGRTFV